MTDIDKMSLFYLLCYLCLDYSRVGRCRRAFKATPLRKQLYFKTFAHCLPFFFYNFFYDSCHFVIPIFVSRGHVFENYHFYCYFGFEIIYCHFKYAIYWKISLINFDIIVNQNSFVFFFNKKFSKENLKQN